MKVLTLGWLSVFFYIFLMNVYLWNSYRKIPFQRWRIPKISSYSFLHIIITFLSARYFYMFFKGRMEREKSEFLSYIAGFYISFMHYSVIFYLLHDLFYFSGKLIAYPESFLAWVDKIFFGGFLIFGLSAIISIVGLRNSRKLVTTDYRLLMDRKDSVLESLNIVYISDAHIGTSVNYDNIDELIREAKLLKPDLLLLGGDFFDEGTTNISKKIVSQKLQTLAGKYGVYYVEGNHEYKSDKCDIDEEMEYFREAGIEVLQDQLIEVDSRFYLAGRRDRAGKPVDLNRLLSSVHKDLPLILLDHRPGFKESGSMAKVDLQISGHTHSGQFFPFQILDPILARFTKSYNYGYHKIGGLHHIVSSGAGNWGIPVRIGSLREIVSIKIDFI